MRDPTTGHFLSKSDKTVKTVGDQPKVRWQPARLLDTLGGLDERFTYRWTDRDAANLVKRQAEGWEIVNRLDGDKVAHTRPGEISDGAPLTPSLTEYRELILMRIPRELAGARTQYYDTVTEDRVAGLKAQVAGQARALGGEIEGSITVGERVIE